jgi:hypothetical protein
MSNSDTFMKSWLDILSHGFDEMGKINTLHNESIDHPKSKASPIEKPLTSNQLKRELLLRKLDVRQRKALKLFNDFEVITSTQIGKLFKIQPRTSSQLCKQWVECGFLVIVNESKKARCYKLNAIFESMITNQ